MTTNPNELYAIIFVLLLVIVALYGKYNHYLAKSEQLEEWLEYEKDSSGWMEETRYLRRLQNPEAAREVEEQNW